MRNPFNPLDSSNDAYTRLKNRLRDIMWVELEGTINTASNSEMQMVAQLFDDLLQQESVTLSQAERRRLFDAVVGEIADRQRRR